MEKVLEVLRALAQRHGSKAVNPDSVANVIAARPYKPLVRGAHDCAAWWDASSRRLRDVVSAYRNWLDKTDDLAGTERLDTRAGIVVAISQKPAAIRYADRHLDAYPQEAS
jgi:hypothetical protein